MLGRRKKQILLTVLGTCMLTYCALILPRKSYWHGINSLNHEFITKTSSDRSKSPVASDEEDLQSAMNRASEWDFLADLLEEDNDSRESTEEDAFPLNLPATALDAASPPPTEWNTRLPLTDFPHLMKCSQDRAVRRDNSLVYPCKFSHHGNTNDALWPVLIQPSNGELLRRISRRQYSDPHVRMLRMLSYVFVSC